MGIFDKSCDACKSKDEIIVFLKEQVNHLRKERQEERVEYKRAMDVLLMKQNLPPLGQGVGLESKQPSVQDILQKSASVFDEVEQ